MFKKELKCGREMNNNRWTRKWPKTFRNSQTSCHYLPYSTAADWNH